MNETTCAHEGWGMYPDENGPCPPPAYMRAVEGGLECMVCRSRVSVFTGPDALERAQTYRETAVQTRIERR